MCGGAATEHHCHLAKVEVDFLVRTVLQDALSEVTKIYPLLSLPPSLLSLPPPSTEVEVFVDDITALLRVKTRKWQKRRKRASNCQLMNKKKSDVATNYCHASSQ